MAILMPSLTAGAKNQICNRNITEMETGWPINTMFTEIDCRAQKLLSLWCFAFHRRLRGEALPILDGEGSSLKKMKQRKEWQQ